MSGEVTEVPGGDLVLDDLLGSLVDGVGELFIPGEHPDVGVRHQVSKADARVYDSIGSVVSLEHIIRAVWAPKGHLASPI